MLMRHELMLSRIDTCIYPQSTIHIKMKYNVKQKCASVTEKYTFRYTIDFAS